ncbi:S1 RNA-binding domain-containing protein 1 isoform X2 [Oncorhynchus tshawytscha]|uniref:S1 motif domain-containing protein n=1 Tax=Oncorhynchus tshawytscha TaxID=74940 RepID=A0A8C8FJN4_ONCTS|nr:S1 RNA-binding domain-containing protein 1 isoform X2 [Oncorhynchus tshawytscha]
MQRRTRTVKVYTEKTTDGDSDEFPHTQSASEDEIEEWQPESKAPKRQQKAQPSEKKPVVKRQAKPKEPKESKPKAPRKPVERKPRAPRAPKAPKPLKAPKPPKEPKPPKVPRATKGGKKQQALLEEGAGGVNQTNSICDAAESQQSARVKKERLSFIVPDGSCNNNMSRAGGGWSEGPSSSHQPYGGKKEEPEEDFAFDEPSLKRQKTSSAPQGRPTRLPTSGRAFGEDLNMNWDLIQLLSERTGVDQWVCLNISQLFKEENTIPFIVRYRKEMINHMDADAVRDVQLVLEEIYALAKKTQTISQTLKKEGVLTAELEQALRNCRTADELDHVYAPYKKGSKLSKACRARQLGLESAAQALLQSPYTLDLRAWVKPGSEGLSTLEEVSTGVVQILADIIAKDGETLTHIRSLCDKSMVMLQSSVSRTALKEQQKEGHQGKPKDIDKFHLYCDFTCNVQHIQHHQTLAINRGENLKILTVKVNIPDRVKSDFCRWCLNVRWRPKGYPREELMKILRDAVEDSYKRLLLPLLSRSYRAKLTGSAEKESIAMFVRNLRQRLLVCPVRGRVIMGVDPGFRHGCKLAVLSPTSQILFTDVVYLHGSGGNREADKLRHLMIRYSCNTVVIGNGTACRETEAFFADLISRRFFQPLDVSYCITSEAGASIYSVSPAAVKEMPDLDPNLRSAVSIGRRVQDPLAELVKIDPKHIGIGTYQHDVSQSSLKAALDGVVQECVSFVGVDINICSETLMRHVAGLNTGRAKSIAEWRETNGPFMNRDQLRLVKGLGPKSYQQCAGFIRINPLDHLNNHSDAAGGNSAQAAQEKPAAKGKGKTKASAAVPTLPNPLDQTCIHPESYAVARSFLSLVGGSVDQMGRPELRQCVEASVKCQGLEALAETLNTTPDTLQLIIDGLTQPPGFDIRQDFEKADFKRGIVSMSDLREGVVLTGRVENATLFGAFVDIGVGRNGLIHKKYITPDKLPADQRRRSLALGPGEKVEVRVLNVDHQRGRIGLDLIRVLR